MNTTLQEFTRTVSHDRAQPSRYSNELVKRYDDLVTGQRLSWTAHQKLNRLLGQGGQGVVYLSERRGADYFTLPIALKVFSPEHYEDTGGYDAAMSRIARVAARVAQIQQDNLLDVLDFIDRNRIRMMLMEWVDGYDLARLLVTETLEAIEDRVSAKRWEYINRVIVTRGPVQPRIKPGVAVAIVRDCLAALAALHREGIVHGDVKPSNIMLKRAGNVKVIDIGSAYDTDDPPPRRACTPRYAAPEILDGGDATPRSDLASLGYVLVEMLSGRPAFGGLGTYADLLEAKRFFAQRLPQILPAEVTCNQLLMNFCQRLVAPDPMRRFPSAEAADLVKEGAAAFHRQLVKNDLSSEYSNEIRLWLGELHELDQMETEGTQWQQT